MRRHAKATATGANHKRGAAAEAAGKTRVGSPSLRALRVARVLLPAVFVALLVSALFAGGAAASAPVVHPFVTSFGSFSSIEDVAADDSGNVYVLAGGKLSKFDEAGNPVDFSALSTNVITGLNGGGSQQRVAVDNSGGLADGDIYVTVGAAIHVFAASGTEIGVITEVENKSASIFYSVAVGPTGTLYAGANVNSPVYIARYKPTHSPITNADFDAEIRNAGQNGSIAADSSGAVYHVAGANSILSKYAASQFGALSSSSSTVSVGAYDVAVDPDDDDVYAARASDIAVFDSAGNSRGAFGSGHFTNPTGIAVSSAGVVFVAAGGTVSVYGPPLVLPDVTIGAPDGITATTATLHGTVKPGGVAVTDCHFEYGTTTSYGPPVSCTPTPGTVNVNVSAPLTGLQTATTYHYRLVVSNANGTSESSDGTFDTAGKPGITETQAESSGTTSAVVTALINPRLSATTYHVEYGLDGSYGQSTSESGPIGSDGVAHEVTATLTGLQPGSTYHLRFVATNSSGASAGADATVQSCLMARSGPSAVLPDCRAYEQVTPRVKNGTDMFGAWLSSDGNAAATVSYNSYPSSPGAGSPLIVGFGFNRTDASWRSFSISPLASNQNVALGQNSEFGGSADFTKMIVESRGALTPGMTDGNRNIYYWDTTTGTYEAIVSAPKALPQMSFAGAAADGSRFFFSNKLQLPSTPPAPAAPINLYEYLPGGTLNLVGVLPDGTVASTGAIAAGNDARAVVNHVVSADGSRIYWKESSGERHVYLRESGETRAVSKDQSGTVQPAAFWYATPSGAKAFITSSMPLTAGASPTGSDLYSYDADARQLTDLTPGNASGAGVLGVFGASDDGSYVYFLATGALAPGAVAGQANVFVRHNGDTRFLGALASGEAEIVSNLESGIGGLWRVSPDGLGFGFLFKGAISGPNPQPAQPFSQAYYYSYGDDSLACASCPSTGLPQGPAFFQVPGTSPTLIAYQNTATVATNGGRLFFETSAALVPEDVNTVADVYEYEGGKLSLVSTGHDSQPTSLEGVSQDGNTVLIRTYQSLVGQDEDDDSDAYVARVNGGFASQNPGPPAPPCDVSSGACEGPGSSAPARTGAGSAAFQGPGNIPHKQKQKQKKKHHKAKHVKKHHKGKHAKNGKARHHHRSAK